MTESTTPAPARTTAGWLAAAALFTLSACASSQGAAPDQFPATDDPHLTTAYEVLSEVPLIDGHNDLPGRLRDAGEGIGELSAYDLYERTEGHTDVPRLREGGIGGQFWSVYIPSWTQDSGTAARMQLEQIDIAHRMIDRYPELELALSPDDVERIFENGRIASMIGMEGGHAIENSLGALRSYYRLGARYMTLTHSANIDWADSCCEAPELDGLSAFGEEVVREMNRLGMLVDLSHVSPATMHDVLDLAEAPVIFSHSSARAVTDHPRNVPDEVLRRMPENGGVVMVTYVTSYVNEELRRALELPADERPDPLPEATLQDVADHIEHVRDVAGIDHVGLGSDYDGATMPVGLEDVSTFPALLAELSRRGWTEQELKKLAGLNVLRAWRQAEQVAGRLQQEAPAAVASIAQLDGVIEPGEGAFVTRLGADTIAVESFRYTPTSFEAEVVLRVPETVLTVYRGELDQEGALQRLAATAYDPADLEEPQPDPLARTTYSFVGDSVHVDVREGGTRRSLTTAASPAAIPFIDMVHWPFELALMRLAPDGQDVEIPMLVGRRAMPFGFSGFDGGQVTIRHPYRGTMAVNADERGRIQLLDAAGTTRKVVVRRVDPDDIDLRALAREFAAREARGGGIGDLSGRGEAEGEISGASVVVDYGRPRKRGREIFGALVPFGEVWRTGADRATHLTTDRDLVIGETRVPAGTYTLFTIPGPEEWTLIVNRKTDIGGTGYDASADFARIPMDVRSLPETVEEFTIRVDPDGFLRLQWDRTEAVVPVRPAR